MSQLFTSPDVPQVLTTTLSIPYTLTPGGAAGQFLAGLAERRILGSRCEPCARTVVPAQDVCGRCGEQTPDLVELPHGGTVTSWTAHQGRVVAKIRLDGADADLLHVVAAEPGAVEVGDRVAADWAAEPTGWITDLAAFTPGRARSGPAEATPVARAETSVEMVPYRLDLTYHHAYGPYYGRMFDELGSFSRLMGSRCSSCHRVLLPARAICDVCFARTDQFDEVSDTGVLQAFSVIHMEFVGQTRKPPYVYAEIVLDGSSTRLIHTVAGDFDLADAASTLSIGMKVKAVWKPESERVGTLEDIAYFEPVIP
ncbi:Zn-ribbon domain-containing OB-fold protein [Acrocarpospora catenulata]|uniref:Zn-ribbon domain-containing OB-fold protein n=1 Tax=Acrocarpospora catenulata TaxID=2836182 RepID=UPI001BD9F5B7|nr:OB-fold nucleic acid binding domain-containing protein [Acrocarpospora catenulata]